MLKPSSKNLLMRFEKSVDGNNDKKKTHLMAGLFFV